MQWRSHPSRRVRHMPQLAAGNPDPPSSSGDSAARPPIPGRRCCCWLLVFCSEGDYGRKKMMNHYLGWFGLVTTGPF